MLAPETKELWQSLQEYPSLLSGFVMIGGTALALQINHRVSEDLDLAFVGLKLPRRRIAQLLDHLREKGLKIIPNDNPAALDDFIQGGEDLHDFQQDHLVGNKLKLTFIAPDSGVHQILAGAPTDPLRIATVKEIFQMKCLVTSQRSKSRDWFDLYTLFTRHDYTVTDLRAVFSLLGRPLQADLALARLALCKMLPHDEGYAQLTDNPPSLETMAEFFRRKITENEVSLAKAALGVSRGD